MKTRWMVALLLIAGLSFVAGCKKEPPVTPPAEPAEQETTGVVDSMKKAADETVRKTAEPAEQETTDVMDSVKKTADETVRKTTETVKEAATTVKESFTTNIDLEKTAGDLKAEAAQMDVASLEEAVVMYKIAIAENKAELKALADKLSAIPLTEKLGKEAQALTSKVEALTDRVTTLQTHLQVYLDALNAIAMEHRPAPPS